MSANQHLGKLVGLNMKDCVHLTSLPDMADLELLLVLDLSGCSNLNDIQGFPRNLEELYLAGTAIKEFPQLPLSLEILNAHGCVSRLLYQFLSVSSSFLGTTHSVIVLVFRKKWSTFL